MRKNIFFILILLLLLFIASLFSLGIGELSIPITNIGSVLSDQFSLEYGVLSHIRIPRTLLAIAIGGSLSLAGVILQGIYRNPLVEPYTLGISGGASLGITLVIVSGLNTISLYTLPLFGFIGAFATIFLVYFISLRRGIVSVKRMLLIGVMISFISSSLIMFLMSVTDKDNIHSIVFWTMGSLNESNPILVRGMLVLSLIILFFSYLFVSPLNALRLGETKARYLGVNTQYIIRMLFILTSLLTGCSIAVAGVIGFVGLVIPHISRFLVGTDYRFLLITSFLSGGIFLMFCDILARVIIAPNELPIGVITGIVGGIAFIIILCQSQMKSNIQ